MVVGIIGDNHAKVRDIMKKFALIISLVLAIVASANTQRQQISFTTPASRQVVATALTDNIIKVTNTAFDTPDQGSKVVLLPVEQSGATVTQLPNGIELMKTPSGITVTGDKSTGILVINAGDGKSVIDNGIRNIANDAPYLQQLTLLTSAKGSYYGAGERGHSLNLRGDTLMMYNRQNYGYTGTDPRIKQMNITMPLFLSSDGFAIVFDDYAAAQLTLGNDQDIDYRSESNSPISYYFVNGASTLADVTRELSNLIGRQPLPPLWSLGYITSKYGYHNEKETLGVIDTLKTHGYPVDGVVLDLYWYGKEQDMGALAWAPEQWPDPEGMLKKLADENVHLVAISQPYVLRNGRGIDNYNTLAEAGMLVADSTGTKPQEVVIWVGEGGMLDVANNDTKAWLRERYRQLTDMGVSGWWGDLGEPEVHPESGLHANGLKARQYHNLYGNEWSEIIYDLFKEQYPDRRLMTMMRGGTTGLQRYSVFPWSTDVSRSWGGLEPQIRIMLNSGLSGLGYMGHDVGGFAVDADNPEDAELYVRWLQLGTFSPVLRTHAQYKAEPYHYEQYESIILPLIKERYRWLPYNYTLAYENAKYGYPLVRPLNYYEPRTNAYDNITDEYLWGSEVLVAPVITQGAVSRNVTFPKGMWVDMANPRVKYAGTTTVSYNAPLDVLPLFAKAGAFIPLADYDMDSTADYNPAEFTVNYYPVAGFNTQYSMYDDNRMSPAALTDNQYRLINFTGKCDDSGATVSINTHGTYAGASTSLHITLKMMGLAKAPTKTNVKGCNATTSYDALTGTCTFDITAYDPDDTATLSIEF